ncbi:MAG: DUF1127 domain-containing protein [Roseiarcus sp.]
MKSYGRLRGRLVRATQFEGCGCPRQIRQRAQASRAAQAARPLSTADRPARRLQSVRSARRRFPPGASSKISGAGRPYEGMISGHLLDTPAYQRRMARLRAAARLPTDATLGNDVDSLTDDRARGANRNREEKIAMKMFSLARFLRRRRTYNAVLEELSRYSDHELHDIGIDRADIYDIADRASQEQQ